MPARPLFLIAIFSAIFVLGDGIAEAPPAELTRLKQRYAEELAKTSDEKSAFISRLNANYLVSLAHYDSERRKVSDLDAMFAIRDETNRMKKHGTMRPSDVVKAPAGLAALQQRYLSSVAKHAGDIARREVPVHRLYISLLEPLQDQFAEAERFEDAILVRDEIAAVRKRIPRPAPTGNSVNVPSALRKGLELQLGFPRKPGLVDKRTATTAFDRSGKRNHATLEGTAKWIADGRLGGAIELGGGSDRIVSTVDTAGRGTVCAWIKSDKTLDATSPALELVSTGGGIGFFVVNGDSGAIDFSIAPTEGESSVCSTKTTEWRAGSWYFLCCSWDGENQRIYVNGKLEGEHQQTHSHTGDGLIIGSSEFGGTVDEVMKWDRALSESEVVEVFQLTGG